VGVAGRVDDVGPYLASAQVAVVPLHSGSGTRLKILDAFAAGVPVVSTTVGAEGINGIDGEHLLIADSAAGFAAAVLKLLREPALRTALTTNARELVERQYTWNAAGSALLHAHDLARKRFASRTQ
ncbi:MAG: glycosyltransferase, partial [Chloroflexota bacterium]